MNNRVKAFFLNLIVMSFALFCAAQAQAQIVTILDEDFEPVPAGWTVNPNGNDEATVGFWAIANPSQTNFQNGTTPSGTNALVTGALTGGGDGGNDIDGGATSISSPIINISANAVAATASFQYYFRDSLDNGITNDAFNNYFAISVISITTGKVSTALVNSLSTSAATPPAYGPGSINLTKFAGQSIRLLFTANGGSGGIAEASVDNLVITQDITPQLNASVSFLNNADGDSNFGDFEFADPGTVDLFFRALITNNSGSDALTITSLTDSFGTVSLAQCDTNPIPANGSSTCTFSRSVTFTAGSSAINTLTMAATQGAATGSLTDDTTYASAGATPGPAISDVFYVPYNPDAILNSLKSLHNPALCSGSSQPPFAPITTLIGITVISPNTVIYYDHFEDGYEPFLQNPVQPTTEVWGDGNTANGIAPGFPSDIIPAGSEISLRNDIDPDTADTVIDFDGRDKIAGSFPIAATRAAWADGSRTLLAGAWEMYNTNEQWGTTYVFPFGQDLASNSVFEYVGASISAQEDNTVVSVDANADGDFLDPGDVDSIVLNEGEAFTIDGGILLGGTVDASKDVRIDVITGDVCANYESRFITLFPRDTWSNNYYNPVNSIPDALTTTTGDANSVVTLYNPHGTNITVSIQTANGAGGSNTTTTVVPANGTTDFTMPTDSGARFFTAAANNGGTQPEFYAITSIDQDNNAAESQAHDWGMTLIPQQFLSTQILVGTGIGRDPDSTVNPTENGSPVWITAAKTGNGNANGGIDICVDFNGDGGPLTDPRTGRTYDTSVNLEVFETARVFDPDGDQTGMLLFVCDDNANDQLEGVITAAWGQDASVASGGQPGLDAGTGIPNLRAILVSKRSAFANDLNGDNAANVGDIITYEIDVTNTGLVPLDTLNIVFEDPLPTAYVEYIPNSTTITDTNNVTSAVPDDTVPPSSTAFPLDPDSPSYTIPVLIPIGETITLSYQVTVLDVPFAPEEICNTASAFLFNEDDSSETCDVVSQNTSVISGFVLEDTNGDGVGDTPIVGATLQLYSDPLATGNPADGALQRTVMTNALGFYEFTDLQAGDYIVVEIDPSGYQSVLDEDQDNVGDIDAVGNTISNDNIIPVSVAQAATMMGQPVVPESIDVQNNFVDTRTGLISGLVWLDEDQDGINDIEESGLTNVTVELRDGVCTPSVDCPTVLTDQFGNYSFNGLPPGNYDVSVIAGLPAGVTNTAGPFGLPVRSVTLPAGGQVIDQDFGYIANANTGIIGDRVWSDADGDGVQDAGESGIAGVTLDLIADPGTDGVFGTPDDGAPVASTTTGADGDYLFTGLSFGDYAVVITDTGNVLNGFTPTVGPQSEGGLVSDPVTINAAVTTLTDVDFGFDSADTLAITDRVWYDADGDQIQDPGESGIAGVTVDLLNQAGNVVATTTTNNLGDFSFSGVPEGDDYQILISDRSGVLNGLTETTTTGGSAIIAGSLDSAAGADNLLDTIGDDGTVTFGYNNPGSIAGTIFSDADSNAAQGLGEPGIGGVQVTLTPPAGVDLGNGPGVAITTTTAPDGSYLFDGLPPGDYTLDVLSPPPGTNTVDPDSTPGNNNAGPISLALGESVINQDFGYFDAARNDLSGTVFLDVDKDGVEEVDGADGINGTPDDEVGIANISLDLIDCGLGTCSDGDEAVIAMTITDANGDYSFVGLADGDYQVAVTDTNGLLAGYDLTSGLDVLNATIAGADVVDVDFGYIKDEATGSISGEVFLDENGNNLADSFEANYGGVDVYICSAPVANEPCDPTDPEFIGATVTDANGEYVFNGLPAGNYLVDVDPTDLPAGLDNTVDPAPVALSEGERVDDVDFGYVPAAGNGLISGTTWIDADSNGVFDSGESPLGGVTILVFDPNSATPAVPIGTIITADDGTWELALSGPTLVDDLIVRYVAPINPNLDFTQPTNLPLGVTEYSVDDVDVASDPDRFIGDLNFGFPPATGADLGSIAGTIYSDTDMNGDYLAATDGEFEGVTINLLDGGGNVIATTTTNANGAYSFTGLLDDSYSVVVTDIDNVLQDLNVLETITLPIVISGGNDVTDQDQGYITETTATLGSIGSLVFIDTDMDGFFDDGEPRVPGVTVQCWVDTDLSSTPNDPGTPPAATDPEAGVDNLVRTVTTDENGEYYCTNLPEGQYIVRVTDVNGVLTGYPDTSPNNTTNDPGDNWAKPFTYVVTTTAGNANLAADFGVEAPSTISGTVYFDDDVSGDYEVVGTDLPLGGIAVEACDANNVCITVYTEPDGSYTIPVGPGNWTVTVLTPPMGTSPLEVPSNPVVVGVGDDVTEIDFGYIDRGSEKSGIISGNVSEDTTGDGLGDTPLPGVVVELYSDPNADGDPSDGVLIATQSTNGAGDYSFDVDLNAGSASFVVVEVDPADYASISDAQSVEAGANADIAANTNTNDNLIPVTLNAFETDANNDFVDVLPASISGQVWLDEDLDGINDIEEAGLTGIIVELVDDGGNVVATTSTDQFGNYVFDGVPPGDYTVNVDDTSLPAGLQATAGPGGVDPKPVTVAPGDTIEDVDFGYHTVPNTGAIGDRVWSDANGNGIQDLGEVGIEGVTLTLLDASGNPVGAPVVTGSDGDYLFTNVPFGNDYTVTIAPADPELAGYTPTSGPQSEGGYVGSPVSLKPALTTVTDIDFGFNLANDNTIIDTVWFDENGDGVFDANESPIPGVTVNIYRDNDNNGVPDDNDGDGQPDVLATSITDANGDVTFTGLEDDTYILEVTDTASELQGLNGTTPEAVTTFSDPVSVAGGVTDDQDSFGYNNPGLISGTVFSDANGVNGQDPGEVGLGNITVTLLEDTNDNGIYDTVVAVVQTAPDGSYSFDGLPPGDYQVVVTPPVGLQTEDPDAALDNLTEITLGIGESSVDNDFGYQNTALADVSGTVFLDTDKDGVEEVNGNDGVPGNGDDEPGFAGITLDLINCGLGTCNDGDEAVIGSTTTDASGDYTFPDLPNGSYQVAVTDQTALLAGYDLTSGLDQLSVIVAGVNVNDVDFGYIKDEATGSISGEVFIDETIINGLADDPETNLSGVTIYLCASVDAPCTAGNAIATTLTDAVGEYVFSNLPAGQYAVDSDPATVPGGLDLTVDPDPIALSEGENVSDVDIGYQPSANSGVLSGFVWTDVNSDGIYNPAEAPISGVRIYVYSIQGTPPTGPADALFTATTAADGSWILTGISGANLQDGYFITYEDTDIPAALESAQPTNLPLGDDLYNPVNLLTDVNTDDGVISYLDFAFPPRVVGGDLGSISGTIYSDTDQNGDYLALIDGELNGVTINLLNAGGAIIATTMTDANGGYIFDGLIDGDYQVVVTDRDNVLQDLNPNEVIANPVTIVGAADITDQDAGYISDPVLGSIGNKFWLDSNANGIVDDDEPGIAGVTIQCWVDSNANATPNLPVALSPTAANELPEPGIDNLVRTVVTDENGEYYCTSLPTGQYIVRVFDSLNYDEANDGTIVNVGTTAVEDNNAKPWVYALTTASPNLRADFGVRGRNSISGNVFIEDEDLVEPDGNGVIDPGELDGVQGGPSADNPAQGVTVILYVQQPDGSFTELRRTTTVGNGNYFFNGLPNGTFRVEVAPSGSSIDGFGQTGDPDLAAIAANPEELVCDSPTAALCDDATEITLADNDATGLDFGYQKNFVTTPVTINSFSSTGGNGSVTFTWQTSNEVGHLGYQLYARGADEWILLNEQLINIVDDGDALDTREYSFTAYNVDATWFALVDVSTTEELSIHGPYRLGESYGAEVNEPKPFDWSQVLVPQATPAEVQRSVQNRIRALEAANDEGEDAPEDTATESAIQRGGHN